MNVFASLGILLLAMLIIASMKLIPGIFALFYHFASGKFSLKKTSSLTIFFILGVETLPVVTFLALNCILNLFSFTDLNPTSPIVLWTLAGLFIALGISFFLFYFRKGKNTQLFISRKTANNIEKLTRNIKKRSDAFALGFIAGVPELIFTLPLYLITLITTLKNHTIPTYCSYILVLFILCTISPLFFIYAYFRNGNNLANFERIRIKNKSFFRIFISMLYIVLAIIIVFLGAYI